MADPIGNLFGRLLTGWFGFILGEKVQQRQDAAKLEHQKYRDATERMKQASRDYDRANREETRNVIAELQRQFRDRKAALERQARHERERLREHHAQLNDERINAIANRVYACLYAKLVGSVIDANHPLFVGQKFPIRDLLGNAALAKFALETAEFVRRELRQQP